MKLPKLSLRELFLLVALVAMGFGWWRDHRYCMEGWRAAAFNHAWCSNVLESLGYTQIFKNARVADIVPPATNP